MNMKIGMGNQGAGATRITLTRTDGTVMGTMTYRKSAPKPQKKEQKKKTRKLEYNFKQVSNGILQAKTSGSAGRVLTKARSKVAVLRQKLVSAQYDTGEITSAILHAEAMVRVARKRVKNLRAEENAERGQKTPLEEAEERERILDLTALSDVDGQAHEEMSQIQQEMQEKLVREMQRIMQEMQEELQYEMSKMMDEALDMEELSDELAGAMDEMKPEDLEQLRKKHRSEEMREIMEADMKYLKALFDRLAKEKQDGGGGFSVGGENSAPGAPDPGIGAVTLELAGVEQPVPAEAVVAEVVGGNVDMAI